LYVVPTYNGPTVVVRRGLPLAGPVLVVPGDGYVYAQELRSGRVVDVVADGQAPAPRVAVYR
jgi:hypothetical protein